MVHVPREELRQVLRQLRAVAILDVATPLGGMDQGGGGRRERGRAAARAAERRGPDLERFRDFQHEFESPAYLARQVADFLRGHDRGVLLLTGPGGRGQEPDHAGPRPRRHAAGGIGGPSR
jgi:hypothetical protein